MFGRFCIYCKYEPEWKGGEKAEFDIRTGICRKPKLPCDSRHPIEMDTEYLVCESVSGIIEDCPEFEPKE